MGTSKCRRLPNAGTPPHRVPSTGRRWRRPVVGVAILSTDREWGYHPFVDGTKPVGGYDPTKADLVIYVTSQSALTGLVIEVLALQPNRI